MKREKLRHSKAFLAITAPLMAALCLALAAFAQQAERDRGEDEQVLLLRNGETIRGTVFLKDDRYKVLVPGGEILVRKSEVVSCCRDLEEVYEQKLKIIRPDNVQERLELAQWCQRVGLVAAAQQELNEAKQLNPAHPLIPLLDRRLDLAGQPSDQHAVSPSQHQAGPTAHELDLMVRGMPPRTVEAFAQSIQPMLLNSCAVAGCHGQNGAKGFQMLRVPSGTVPSRRLTQRNLYAVLGYVNQDNPGASPLVSIPKRPHGTARAPIFTDHQYAQYRQLLEWCYRVAQSDQGVVQASYEEPMDFSERNPKPFMRNKTRKNGDPNPLGLSPRAPNLSAPSQDPFDPDAFNRQFAPPAPREQIGRSKQLDSRSEGLRPAVPPDNAALPTARGHDERSSDRFEPQEDGQLSQPRQQATHQDP